MEAEVGAQVGDPHGFLRPVARFHEAAAAAAAAPALAKKRDAPWRVPAEPQHLRRGDWNPKVWTWDGVRFLATRVDTEERKDATLDNGHGCLRVDSESLELNLGGGGGHANAVTNQQQQEQPVPQPSKKVRSGSPGSAAGGGGGYPMCQVDDCRADLSAAKDYHRRHKVCENHSKAIKAIVAKQMQRFCQQCSRFHPLSEFDEGKRSCRRRLAGHNRRRRKTQQEDAPPSRLLPTGGRGSNGNGEVEVANLLVALARLQGNGADKLAGAAPALPGREHVIEIFSKINSMPSTNNFTKVASPMGLDLNASQTSRTCSLDHGAVTAPSTMNLLAALSSGHVASTPSQGSSGESSGADRTRILQSQSGIPKHPVREARSTLPFQLFTCDDDENIPRHDSIRKCMSSESSEPMDDTSPSCSPPVTQKLFPIESREDERPRTGREDDNITVEASTGYGWIAPLNFLKDSTRLAGNDGVQNSQAGYTSSSGSDHSPSSSNSDGKDRTGRILFKLFDKDPSNLPVSLRNEIINWLSNSPSDMESYIRPGCLVLSVYVSMQPLAWNELEKDLLQRISSLVHSSEFWRSDRFLVQTNRQQASYKDGRIHLCKSWKTSGAPELTFVSPLAVVSGQETSLSLRGRNLTVPGTKIHCTFMGGYKSKEVLGSVYPGTVSVYDAYSSESFRFPGGFTNGFGRCFIEVDSGLKGNAFPIIIAEASICQELRSLEPELEEDRLNTDFTFEGQAQAISKDDIFHFLNELGWLFQQKASLNSTFLQFSCTRFRHLLLFSVERDWSAIVRILVDTLVERSSKGEEQLQESLYILAETELLNRAVKRKCRRMIDLLLTYSVKVDADGTKVYIFPPNSSGPCGLTPLHIAASMSEAEGIVDMLTNDPQEIGLKCWNTMKDDNGQTPYVYASMRNNHSYNKLVAMKLIDRLNGQVSIRVGNEESLLDKSWIVNELEKPAIQPLAVRSCARCAAICAGRVRPRVRNPGLLQRSFIISMLAVASVCVCVCLFYRSKARPIPSFKWENLDFGPS